MKTDPAHLDYIGRWQKTNWERVLEYKRRWRAKHAEQNRQCQKAYRDANKAKIQAYNKDHKLKRWAIIVAQERERRRLNPARYKEAKRRFYLRHRERLLAERKAKRAAKPHYKGMRKPKGVIPVKKCPIKRLDQQRAWCARNRERIRFYVRRRRATDPQFDIAVRLRSRITSVLRRKRLYKTNTTLQLIGCSLNELRLHLESRFLPGMNWENRKLWHIDHIKPCASFNLADPEQQKLCFHYTNLQPLWAADNQSKGVKIAA